MIEAVTIFNREKIMPIVEEYQKEYRGFTEIDETKNKRFYRKFYEQSDRGGAFISRNDEGEIIAFATYCFVYESNILEKVAVMNDLYVKPDYRGRGIAKLLINNCLESAKAKGAHHVQWKTKPENDVAKSLYDRFASERKDWVVYTLN